MKSSASRVQKHRDNLRHKGLKLIQIWVPDTHYAGFAAECRRQSLLARDAQSEKEITEAIADTADLRGWE